MLSGCMHECEDAGTSGCTMVAAWMDGIRASLLAVWLSCGVLNPTSPRPILIRLSAEILIPSATTRVRDESLQHIGDRIRTSASARYPLPRTPRGRGRRKKIPPGLRARRLPGARSLAGRTRHKSCCTCAAPLALLSPLQATHALEESMMPSQAPSAHRSPSASPSAAPMAALTAGISQCTRQRMRKHCRRCA